MSYKTKTGFYRAHKKVTQDNLELDRKTGELVPIPSMTKQSFAEAADINNILKQYKTPAMRALLMEQAGRGLYQDLPDPIDFQESMDMVIRAEASFETLPSKIRNQFGNDPVAFLEFMHDEKNQEQIYEWGLAQRPPPPPPPAKVEIVNGVQGRAAPAVAQEDGDGSKAS